MAHKNGQPRQNPSGLQPRSASTPGRARNTTPPAALQRDHERSRVAINGKRTDDGGRCTVIVIHEVGDTWALYLHGARQLGVRLTKTDAMTIAQAVLAGAQ